MVDTETMEQKTLIFQARADGNIGSELFAISTIYIMKEVRKVKLSLSKGKIFGLLITGVGTLVMAVAEDKEMKNEINEAVEAHIIELENDEES